MIKGLECPYCNNKPIRIWRFFVLPPLFLMNITCMSCNNQVRINWHALLNVVLAVAVASVVGILIDKIYSFESILFDVVFYVFAAYVPFLLGQKLFLKYERHKGS
jgi:hypothetical protein